MRKLMLSTILVLGLAAVLFGQQQSTVAFHFDYAYQTKDVPEIYSKLGIGLGVTGKIATTFPILSLTTGARYLYFPESNEVSSAGNVKHDSFDMLHLFLGVQLGRDSGPYFTLAECGDFGGKKARFGIEPGIGYLVWEGPGSTRVDFTLKYCMANLMGGEEDEADRQFIIFGMGYAF